MIENVTLFDVCGMEEFREIESKEWFWHLADLKNIPHNGLKVFSCFACGGGSTMGYKLAGCDVIGCVEIDKRMNDIYVRNHNPKHNFLMDIRDFNKIANDQLPQDLFNLDILDGSPPCTTFSMAGEREDSWGKVKRFKEGQAEQTLDDLSFVFIETVAKLRPKMVVMENVKGLLMGDAWAYVQKIYSDFNKIGYKLHHWLVRGVKMGVPQNRQRVIFVAIRNDICFSPSDLSMNWNYKEILAGDILVGDGYAENPESAVYKLLAQTIPTDKDLGDVCQRLGEKDKMFNEYVIFPDRVFPTLTSSGGFHRGIQKTFCSVEDMINASTFPQDFDFINRTKNSVQFICGMSVPPLMIKRVVERILEKQSQIFKEVA